MNLGESELSIDKEDLEQEGCIGLLDAIPRFDSSKGTKFLTYAAPSIRNAMTNLIRDAFSRYEHHRSRFMWNTKYCVNCMQDSIGLEGESKPICCTVMA